MSNRFFQRAAGVVMRAVRQVAGIATVAAPLCLSAFTAPAQAFTLEQHRALVEQFINTRHADPLVADCAAHASFVVATLPGYESVEYGDTALDPEHAKIEPWSGPFDDRKQRVDVTQMVELDGVGKRTSGQTDNIHIRCGYAEGRMMGFDYTSPLSQVEQPVKRATHGNTRGKASHATARSGKHGTAAKSSGSKSSAKSSSSKSSSTKKSTTKKTN
ncbi:BspC domain-containing protein [Pandoraea sp. NPDC087047]|uniref:BspC domain-containing protein n=1 Tax=Pandoraea sp. NPDC087047 TaxID=3364390 RepID=UPI003819EF1C